MKIAVVEKPKIIPNNLKQDIPGLGFQLTDKNLDLVVSYNIKMKRS